VALRDMIKWNLKNKILFSILAVIMLVSIFIALLARYILISSLTRELEVRGLSIAHSIAERSTGPILTKDKPTLISMVFEESQVGERKTLVGYIFILDTEQEVLASTFIRPFPETLRYANIIPAGKKHSIKLLEFEDQSAYDVAVPVLEGIYDVGSVHVGLSKEHIDSVVGKLRMTFLSFIALIILIMTFITDRLSRNITRPITQLIRMSEEISRDNMDFSIEIHGRAGDEVLQLANSFTHMVQHIKEYRDEIKRSQQKYRSLFHSGPDPIFVLDIDTMEILDANPMAAEVYGYPRKELVGMPFTVLAGKEASSIASAFSSKDEESLAKCIFSPRSIHYKKGNFPFNVNMHVCGTIYEDKPAIITSTNDITDLVEKDAQLIQASKMKTLGEMSAGIAHEINQPLNAIKLGCEYLSMLIERGESPPTDKLHQVSRELSSQVDRASEIITTLREFGRKADLTKDKFDICKPLKGVMQILSQQLKLENIELNLDCAQNLPRILAHKNRLEQVLFNLVTNARDAINMREEKDNGSMPRRIDISTSLQHGRPTITLSDTGIGIPESMLDKIFEPFYTTKEIGKGMGLGLAISYGIVKDYQGDIKVKSTVGKGTTFTLSFPPAD
jgi:PAS domain S-box-containing protein